MLTKYIYFNAEDRSCTIYSDPRKIIINDLDSNSKETMSCMIEGHEMRKNNAALPSLIGHDYSLYNTNDMHVGNIFIGKEIE